MDGFLKLLDHSYIKYSDTSFTFSLLKSTNFFYLYLDTNNINGKLTFNFEYKETSLNRESKNNIPNIPLENLSLVKDEIIFKTLFEGIWEKNTFYITDIYVHNGIVLNHNYKTRYLLVKKILSAFDKNECFSVIKSFSDTSLEEMITQVVPQTQFKVEFILMKKNFMQYIININESKHDMIPEKNTKIHIEQYIEKPKNERMTVNIFSTQKSEIYLVEHKKEDFFLDNDFWKSKFNSFHTFYSVLRVSNIESSKKLRNMFEKEDSLSLECVYNSRFKKFEYLC